MACLIKREMTHLLARRQECALQLPSVAQIEKLKLIPRRSVRGISRAWGMGHGAWEEPDAIPMPNALLSAGVANPPPTLSTGASPPTSVTATFDFMEDRMSDRLIKFLRITLSQKVI